jgi:pimeloyl-ACP methyl ester carboxylesterase
MLRGGSFAATKFQHVVGVGHSFGSIITEAITAQYPTDLDAAVLTGFSINATGQPSFITALDLTIARNSNPLRFPSLSNGYLIANNVVGKLDAWS